MANYTEVLGLNAAIDSLLMESDGGATELARRLIGLRVTRCTIGLIIVLKLKVILFLLTNRKFGLQEIKREIREIEDRLDGLLPPSGPLSTGPFLVRAGENNAVNVKIQNVGDEPIDVLVRLLDLDACPPEEIDGETVTGLPGGCCADDVLLNAPAGNFEVVICPQPDDAPVRAFVSVHAGAAITSAFEYVFRAAEMLTPACELCEEPQ